MTSIETIRNLVEQIKCKCLEWVEDKSGETYFIDPLDREEISAHYGVTHAAVGFLVLAKQDGDANLESVGKKLLTSILNRWGTSSKLPGFHNDFNNFALCVAYDYLDGEIKERVKNTVLSTPDSPHDTVNWIPMRWYVNKCRLEWTKDEKYKTVCETCAAKIKSATYDDGFIDDRLPKGMSFNLQYDVATVAVLQYLRTHGEEVDISKETGALLNAVAPDGDINYLGRGTNQIFAWGLWIYLLLSSGSEAELEKALGYCGDKIPVMLEKNNLMLNDWDGAEKYLWWDYHYCSVYTAHLLFWLVLALRDKNTSKIIPVLSEAHDSGVEIMRKDGWFVTSFSGRSEYLAERGPVIAAIGRDDGKMFVKGTFGPWQGAFGKKYTINYPVISNFFGLLKEETERDWSGNKLLRRLLRERPHKAKVEIEPEYIRPHLELSKNELTITWNYSGQRSICINCPLINEVSACFTAQGENIPLIKMGTMRNQYGFMSLYKSKSVKVTELQFKMEA